MNSPRPILLAISLALPAIAYQESAPARPASAPPREYLGDFPDLVLPQVDFATKTLDNWIAILESPELTEKDRDAALWSIFYTVRSRGGAPPPEAVDAIRKRWKLSGPESTPSTGELETIWTEWGLPETWDPVRPLSSRAADLWVDRAKDELLGFLDGPDQNARRSAALALLARRLEVAKAFRIFVVSSFEMTDEELSNRWHTVSFAEGAAGSDYDTVVVDLLGSPDHDDAWKQRLLQWYPPTGKADYTRLIPMFERMANAPSNGRVPILQTLQRLGGYHNRDGFNGGFEDWYQEDFHFHQPWGRKPLESPELDRALAALLPKFIDLGLADGSLDVPELSRIGALSLRSESARRAISPLLKKLALGRDKLSERALWLLCHLDGEDPEVRAQYVARLNEIQDFDRGEWSGLPCLARHDTTTLAALERVYKNAKNKYGFLFKLSAGNLLDVKTSEMARDLAGRLDGKTQSCWCGMMSLPWKVTWDSCEDARASVKVMKLALTARTKKDWGQDPSAEIAELRKILYRGTAGVAGAGGCNDAYCLVLGALPDLGLDDHGYRAQCFRILMNLDGVSFTTHQRQIANYLSTKSLTEEEKAIVVETKDGFGEQPYFAQLASFGTAALPRVHLIRKLAYGYGSYPNSHWNLAALDAVLRIARMSRSDERLLLTVIREGTRAEALEAIGILTSRAADSPDLRFTARQLLSDPDAVVARAAADLVKVRNW